MAHGEGEGRSVPALLQARVPAVVLLLTPLLGLPLPLLESADSDSPAKVRIAACVPPRP